MVIYSGGWEVMKVVEVNVGNSPKGVCLILEKKIRKEQSVLRREFFGRKFQLFFRDEP